MKINEPQTYDRQRRGVGAATILRRAYHSVLLHSLPLQLLRSTPMPWIRFSPHPPLLAACYRKQPIAAKAVVECLGVDNSGSPLPTFDGTLPWLAAASK